MIYPAAILTYWVSIWLQDWWTIQMLEINSAVFKIPFGGLVKGEYTNEVIGDYHNPSKNIGESRNPYQPASFLRKDIGTVNAHGRTSNLDIWWLAQLYPAW